MSESGHNLHDAFPEQQELLHRLKVENAHFRALADRFHDVTRAIARIEEGLEAASDERLEALKKQRLQALDEVAALIDAQKAGA